MPFATAEPSEKAQTNRAPGRGLRWPSSSTRCLHCAVL